MKVCLICTALLLPSLGYSETKLAGYIVTSDRNTIWADEIVTNKGDDIWNVTVIHEDQPIRSKINKLEIDKIYLVDHLRGCKYKKAIVHLIDGRKFEIDEPFLGSIIGSVGGSCSTRDAKLEFYKFDPINHELMRNSISYNKVMEIQIDSHKGEYKVDSQGNSFPPEYIFSPYTGEKLNFGTFSK